MKIVVLSDNLTDDTRLESEHGLSIYLESASVKYLLDTGASDLFIHNAEVLGIDFAEVDYCLISHGHNDHIGGLQAFLEINKKAKVILSADIPGAEYMSIRRYPHSITGHVDFEKFQDRFIFIKKNTIINHIHIYASIPQKYAVPLGNKNLFIRKFEGEYVSDTFHHELVFLIDDILFTGCAHNGILNILEAIQEPVKISLGGFHLLDSHLDQHYETNDQLLCVSQSLAEKYPYVDFYTGHCTGDRSYVILSDVNNKIHQIQCGECIIK
jgi:7,8-dihydropterin-6-yl-methyl-4-(beta-D-ribofuranosyl)aminobenzene 5'-phosphate synthase